MRCAVILLSLGLASPVSAQDAPCTEPIDVPGWSQPQPLAAGTWASSDKVPVLALGRAAEVALRPVDKVSFAGPLAKAPAPGDQGGLLAFRIGLSGTYRVSLGAGAWVDVVQSGRSLPSIAHAHGAECSGIRKTVDFSLTPGTYRLQLSAAQVAAMRVMIAPVP